MKITHTHQQSHEDVCMSLLKYSFDASGIDIYTALLFGATLLLVKKEDELNPEKVLHLIEHHHVTRSFLIPKWIEQIAYQEKTGKYNLTSLRILGSGGESLKPYLVGFPKNKISGRTEKTETFDRKYQTEELWRDRPDCRRRKESSCFR